MQHPRGLSPALGTRACSSPPGPSQRPCVGETSFLETPSANNPRAEVLRAPWVALCQDSSPQRGLRQGRRGQRSAGEPAAHVFQHRPRQGGSQMHRPGVRAPLCHPTVAETAPGGPRGADGSQGRQCGQRAGERRLLRHSIRGQRCQPRGEAEAPEPIRATEDLLGCEAWPLEASFLYLQKQPFIPTIQS